MDSDLDAVSSFVGLTADSAMFVHTSSAHHAMLNTTRVPTAQYSPFDQSNSATGNLILDFLLLAAVPLVLQFVLSPAGMKEAWAKLRDAVLGDANAGFVFRDITAKTTLGEYCIQDTHDNRFGHILQKAIMAHLTDVLQSKLRGKDVQYEMVDKEMDDDAAKTLEENKKTPKADDWFMSVDTEATQYEAINRLRIGSMPLLDKWIEVQPNVLFSRSIENGNDADTSGNGGDDENAANVIKSKDITTRFQFKSNAKDGTKLIDKLIDDAFVKYQLLELATLANDKNKYMYVQTQRIAAASSTDDDGDGDNGAAPKTPVLVYKRYALGGEKTFGNLFFDEKPALVQLLDNFLHKTGKFAIRGFPYKLGLLLHGPPGTGKTSLIKAVAHHTKRHIVTISLGKIKTNQELMNALFDLRFTVEGVSLPVNMTFEDVVFVMEDIDCAASVVMARGDGKPTRGTRRHRTRSSASSSATDKLNLSGLLNVLDGVIDCPGRIVIMTTNHPEKLDPALVRPGRVSKKLELGYMSGCNIQTMVEYYSQAAFTRAQEVALETLVSADGAKPITPATVEALSAEFDDIDSVLEALQALQVAPDGRDAWLS